MMRKQFFILLSVFLLATFSSCGDSQTDPYTVNYHTGTKGITLNFIKENPPDYVLEGSDFSVGVIVSNEGAYSLDKTHYGLLKPIYTEAYVSGPKSDSVVNEWEQVVLEGRSDTLPSGELDYKFFPQFSARTIQGQRQRPTTDIKVEFCYPYETYLADDICIDTFSADNVRDKVCTIQDKSYSGQGGPVGITQIHYQMQKSDKVLKPTIFILVENLDKGSLLSPVVPCDYQKGKEDDYGKVKLSARLSGELLKCVPETITLNQGRGSARCYMESGGYGAHLNYLSSLEVTLVYTYLDFISKNIEIQKVSGPVDVVKVGDCEPWEVWISGENRCVDWCTACSSASGNYNCGPFFKALDWKCVPKNILNETNTNSNLFGGQTVLSSDCIHENGYCSQDQICCSKCSGITSCSSYDEKKTCNNNYCDTNPTTANPNCYWSQRSGGQCWNCNSAKNSNKCSDYEDEETCLKNPCEFMSACLWSDGDCYTCQGKSKPADYLDENICSKDPCSLAGSDKLMWTHINRECIKCDDVKWVSGGKNEYLYSQSECKVDPCGFGNIYWSYGLNKCLSCEASASCSQYESSGDCYADACGFGSCKWINSTCQAG